MGMFDTVRCEYEGMSEVDRHRTYQTKDFDSALDLYMIDKEGVLWREDYNIEDRSDPNAEGLEKIVGMMTKTNLHMTPVELTDTFHFYDYDDEVGMITYKAQYTEGKLTYFQKEEDNG